MKTAIALCSFVFVGVAMSPIAGAQTGPGAPPAMKLPASLNPGGIPPAPPIPAARSRQKVAKPSAMGAQRTPGVDLSGRTDMSAKAVAFYPIAKAARPSDARKQATAIRSTKRVANANPKKQ